MTANRKPAHLEFVGGKSPRQQIWEKIREIKQFAMMGLVRELPGTIDKSSTRTYVKSLLAGGFLKKESLLIYSLQKDVGVEAPRVRSDGSIVTAGRKQENMWRTLRTVQHPVSYLELANLASTADIAVSTSFAEDYLRNLLNAGYLTQSLGKYRLIPAKNTGPRPPMVQRIKQIYDPNLGKVVWSKGDADEY